MGKENSGSSSTDQRFNPLASKPLQEANANVYHVYQAGSIDGIPPSLVPLLTACHEETVDALRMKVEALQSALASRLQPAVQVLDISMNTYAVLCLEMF